VLKSHFAKSVVCPGNNFLRFSLLSVFVFAILLPVAGLMPSAHCLAGDKPFANASNWQGTGLMEIPTARVLDDGEIRAGVSDAYPFRWYGGAIGVLPGLEADVRLTELLNIKVDQPGFEDYVNFKDKALDLKYQILPESRLLPAIAIGLQDIQGTRLYKSKYLALSRQIFPFDLTIGVGTDRLKGNQDLFGKVGIFGGMELALHDRLNVMAEYNPIEYEKDKRVAVEDGARSRFNFGVRFRVLKGVDLGVSYQRGDTVGATLQVRTKLGEPIRRARPDHPPLAPVDTRPFRERNQKKMVNELYKAIYEKGFRNVKVYTDGTDVTVEFENTKYLSDTKAIGRVLRMALLYSPKDARRLIVISKRLNLHVLKVSVSRDVLSDYLQGKITQETFSGLIRAEMAKVDPAYEQTYSTAYDRRNLAFGFKPDFEPYLNDPAGFFQYRFSIKPYARAYPWDGGAAYARYSVPLHSDIETTLPPAPEDAIRSDIVEYGGTDPTVDRLLFDQIGHLTGRTFGRISIGYFEQMFAGIGGEILTFLGDGRVALGVEADWARKREPETQLGLEDFDAYSLLGNIFYCVPGLNMVLRAQYGQFLAEDQGWRFTVSREFETGAVVGAWYSMTDTDHLTGFNRGYEDKGVFLSLPVEMFKTSSSPSRFNYSISPWTRDVAQTVRHSTEVYGMNVGLLPFQLKHNIQELTE
jgi:hypothetical protein